MKVDLSRTVKLMLTHEQVAGLLKGKTYSAGAKNDITLPDDVVVLAAKGDPMNMFALTLSSETFDSVEDTHATRIIGLAE